MKIIHKLLLLSFFLCLMTLFLGTFSLKSVSADYYWCSSNSDCGQNTFSGFQQCRENKIWQDYTAHTCNNPGTADSYCVITITPKYKASCSSGQVCRYGSCYAANNTYVNNANGGSYVPSQTKNCYPHEYRKCSGNSIYWFDSCDSKQDLYQDCAQTGGICQNGQCQKNQTTNQTDNNQTNYVKHFKTSCYNNDLYWYDSSGNIQDIDQSCQDGNQCTADSCQDNQCVNTLKCDGSTCANGSADYIKYCGPIQGSVNNNSAPATPTTAAISQSPSSDGFLQKWYWYIWAAIIAIMAFSFIIIFRRLSTRV